jgi:8-oxo-dGTP diphosphatase
LTPALQFGQTVEGQACRPRPTAFGLLVHDGLLACVRVDRGEGSYHDLPGGAVDGPESEPQALAREFVEETGLRVRPLQRIAEAGQFFQKSDGEAVNNLGGFWIVETASLAPSGKVEADHELVWMAPRDAVTALRHDAHAWAVTVWLRRFAAG